tara:strand:+ start:554 stop:1165 length:612 start_codon:yes stop_codon:yes gene_type:complete
MLFKIIIKFLPISFLLISCVNNQVSDIQKSANYNLDDYQITLKSTKEFCLNSDLTQEKNKSLVLILTECIKNPNTNQLIRRPISSIITIRFQQEPGLSSYSKITDLIKSNDVKLNNIFNISGHKIIKSYQKGNTLYMSVFAKQIDNSLNTGSKFWKALSLYDNILISTSAYGFSKKNTNHSSYRQLEEKLKSVVNSIEINKSS